MTHDEFSEDDNDEDGDNNGDDYDSDNYDSNDYEPDDDDNASDLKTRIINFEKALTRHFPTLEKISLVRFGLVRSSHTLQLLESCPRLDTLIMHELVLSYFSLTCLSKPKVNWIECAIKDRRQSLIRKNPSTHLARPWMDPISHTSLLLHSVPRNLDCTSDFF